MNLLLTKHKKKDITRQKKQAINIIKIINDSKIKSPLSNNYKKNHIQQIITKIKITNQMQFSQHKI